MGNLTLGEMFEMACCPLVLPESKRKRKRADPPIKSNIIYCKDPDPKASEKFGREIICILLDSMKNKAKAIYERYQKGEIQLPELPDGMEWSPDLLYRIINHYFLAQMTERTGMDFLKYSLLIDPREKTKEHDLKKKE